MNKNIKKKHHKERGSLTVEACIIFPLFLYFFLLLLFLIKLACLQIVLNHAVNETTKQIAANVYPLSFLNEFEEELSLNGSARTCERSSGGSASDSLWIDLLSGNMHLSQASQLVNELTDKVQEEKDWQNLFRNLLSHQYVGIGKSGAYITANNILRRNMNKSILDLKKLSISLVKLPESDISFKKNNLHRRQMWQELEISVDKDDVVLLAEYPVQIPIPFWKKRQLTLRALAVEKAWLKGSNGIYTEEEEGIEFDQIGQEEAYVYRTKTGKKYHPYQHCKYLEKSCIPLTLEEAKKMGLTKHENCPHRF